MTEKSVLFIAYNFPPSGGPSVQRSLKFIKYLPAEGWTPIVLTASESSYPIRDSSLAGDIPKGTQVFRVKSWDINSLQGKFRKFHLGKLHAFVNTLLCLPDSALPWSRFSRSIVPSIIKTYQPDIIYSTSGPYSAHLLGTWIKQTFRIPWVADFRDPWSQNRIIRYPPGYRWINRQMERRVLNAADEVITVSSPVADGLNRNFAPNPRKINIIPNGYDPDDILPSPPTRTKKFTITYTGKFTHNRSPKSFIQAVTELVDKGLIPIDAIDVKFAGSNLDPFIPSHLPFTKLGYIQHKDIGRLLRYSDLLLLVQDPSPGSIGDYSAKVFEYLAANRPILAITSLQTVAAELIMNSNTGRIVEHNRDQIRSAVLDYYIQWKQGVIIHEPLWPLIETYSRPVLTRQLATIFESLI